MSTEQKPDSSLPIDEILEKLRTTKKSDPHLYQEAWDKLPRKTQSAIISYEEHHRSPRSHPSHSHHDYHQSSDTLHTTSSKTYEDHHRPSHAHASPTDWEAPEPSITRHSSTPKAAVGPQPKAGKHEAAVATIEPTDLIGQLKESVARGVPKAHQIIKQAADHSHQPNTLQEVLLATQVYQLELIRISLNKLTETLAKQ